MTECYHVIVKAEAMPPALQNKIVFSCQYLRASDCFVTRDNTNVLELKASILTLSWKQTNFEHLPGMLVRRLCKPSELISELNLHHVSMVSLHIRRYSIGLAKNMTEFFLTLSKHNPYLYSNFSPGSKENTRWQLLRN